MMIIVSGLQAKKVASLKSEMPLLEKVILLDPSNNEDFNDMQFSDILRSGADLLETTPQLFDERWKSVSENDFANICYTSGTTADPKGIILTHRNYTANVEQSLTLMDIPGYYTSLLILPWDHSFGHTCNIYVLMTCGASLASVQTGKT